MRSVLFQTKQMSVRYGVAVCVMGVMSNAHAAPSSEAHVLQPYGDGVVIDWSRSVITASGMGVADLNQANVTAARLGAEQAAKADALAHIARAMLILTGIEGDGGDAPACVSRCDDSADAMRLRAYRVVDTAYALSGVVTVRVERDLLRVIAAVPHDVTASWRTQAQDIGMALAEVDEPASGIVINAKGLQGKPAWQLQLQDPHGQVLLGDAAHPWQGWVYWRSVDAAIKDPRGGDHPRVIKAVRWQGERAIVLRDVDARVVRTMLPLLRPASVIVVLD